MYSFWQELSYGTIIFDLVTLTLNFDLLLKNFNLGCYLVKVAARRAPLSSDNSYFNGDNLNVQVMYWTLWSAQWLQSSCVSYRFLIISRVIVGLPVYKLLVSDDCLRFWITWTETYKEDCIIHRFISYYRSFHCTSVSIDYISPYQIPVWLVYDTALANMAKLAANDALCSLLLKLDLDDLSN